MSDRGLGQPNPPPPHPQPRNSHGAGRGCLSTLFSNLSFHLMPATEAAGIRCFLLAAPAIRLHLRQKCDFAVNSTVRPRPKSLQPEKLLPKQFAEVGAAGGDGRIGMELAGV